MLAFNNRQIHYAVYNSDMRWFNTSIFCRWRQQTFCFFILSFLSFIHRKLYNYGKTCKQ